MGRSARAWMLTSFIGCGACLCACSDDGGGGGDGDGGDAAVVSCVGELEADESGATAVTYLCDANPSADPEAQNACRNAADCAIIDTDEVRELAKNCGLASRGMESDCDVFEQFNLDCVITETSNKIMAPGLSEPCAQCYAETVVCGTQYCLSECAADADAPECVSCQLEAGCRLPFERCSGLERQ